MLVSLAVHLQHDNKLVRSGASFNKLTVQPPIAFPAYARVGREKQLVISENFLLTVHRANDEAIKITEYDWLCASLIEVGKIGTDVDRSVEEYWPSCVRAL